MHTNDNNEKKRYVVVRIQNDIKIRKINDAREIKLEI